MQIKYLKYGMLRACAIRSCRDTKTLLNFVTNGAPYSLDPRRFYEGRRLVCACTKNYRNSDNSGYFPGILVFVSVIRSSTESIAIAMSSVFFDRAVAYALGKLKRHELQIRHVYEGKDVFLWLPTGFGKSICYEALSFICDYRRREHSDTEAAALGPSLVLVISPLVALMTDHVLDLRRRDARAAVLSSGRSGLDEHLLATDEDLASSSLISNL